MLCKEKNVGILLKSRIDGVVWEEGGGRELRLKDEKNGRRKI